MPKYKQKVDLSMGLGTDDREVRAYIYQQISEFEPYITQETLIEVVDSGPDSMEESFESSRECEHSHQIETEKGPKARANLKRVQIRLSENGTTLKEFGEGENLYIAIRNAKMGILKKLESIQDQVVSNSDRHMQINLILANNQVH